MFNPKLKIMKSKLFSAKKSLMSKMQKLNEEELSFLTGTYGSAGGSSGSHSGSRCDATSVHCCVPKGEILEECH